MLSHVIRAYLSKGVNRNTCKKHSLNSLTRAIYPPQTHACMTQHEHSTVVLHQTNTPGQRYPSRVVYLHRLLNSLTFRPHRPPPGAVPLLDVGFFCREVAVHLLGLFICLR